jgi:hypothetical protein
MEFTSQISTIKSLNGNLQSSHSADAPLKVPKSSQKKMDYNLKAIESRKPKLLQEISLLLMDNPHVLQYSTLSHLCQLANTIPSHRRHAQQRRQDTENQRHDASCGETIRERGGTDILSVEVEKIGRPAGGVALGLEYGISIGGVACSIVVGGDGEGGLQHKWCLLQGEVSMDCRGNGGVEYGYLDEGDSQTTVNMPFNVAME